MNKYLTIFICFLSALLIAATPVVKRDANQRVFLFEGSFNDSLSFRKTDTNGFFAKELIEWQNDAIGDWPLNESQSNADASTVYDISGNGNDGTCTDVSLTTGVGDVPNGAALFNGTTSLINTGADMVGILPLTIEVWIYPTGWGELAYGRTVDNNRSVFGVTTGRLHYRSDGATVIYSGIASITLNSWYHVCVTRNAAGDETNFYINGILSGNANQDSGTPEAGTTNVLIGGHNGALTFDGKIASVKIWNYVRTEKQRLASYNGTSDKYKELNGKVYATEFIELP